MIGFKNESHSVLKGILAAALILLLHLGLIALLMILVVFFQGLISYMLWIVVAGLAALVASAYWVYRRLKRQGRRLGDILDNPGFKGRNVEVSLLGGLAAVRLGSRGESPALPGGQAEAIPRLEDTQTIQMRELKDLARLYEKELISLDEYTLAKQRLLRN